MNKKYHSEGKLKEAFVEELYRELSKITCQIPEAFHFDDFELRDGKLYYTDKNMPLMIKVGWFHSGDIG